MTLVRHATQDDFDALWDILIESHRGELQRLFPYDRDKVKAIIERATLNQGSHIGVIDAPDKPRAIAGIVRMSLAEWEWSRCGFIQMQQIYISHKYRRGTGYMDALMDFAIGIMEYYQERTPNQRVILEFGFIDSDIDRIPALDRLFARWGRRVGTTYMAGL